MQRVIDLNCDMGESFGAWTLGQDEAVMPLVSSASIACGFHAGDPAVMRRTLRLAKRHHVAVGAHVAYPDLQGFGRRQMALTPEEVYDVVIYQIGALEGLARAEGVTLAHVKAHGALYNAAARDATLAEAVAHAVRDFDRRLVVFGLAGSAMIDAARGAGLAVANEAFADRRYEADGSLTPRREPDAVIEEPEVAAAQLLHLLDHGTVASRQGTEVSVVADTVCLHGDRPDAAAFARALRARLEAAQVRVRAPGAERA